MMKFKLDKQIYNYLVGKKVLESDGVIKVLGKYERTFEFQKKDSVRGDKDEVAFFDFESRHYGWIKVGEEFEVRSEFAGWGDEEIDFWEGIVKEELREMLE